jgi:hypothetical protein
MNLTRITKEQKFLHPLNESENYLVCEPGLYQLNVRELDFKFTASKRSTHDPGGVTYMLSFGYMFPEKQDSVLLFFESYITTVATNDFGEAYEKDKILPLTDIYGSVLYSTGDEYKHKYNPRYIRCKVQSISESGKWIENSLFLCSPRFQGLIRCLKEFE